MLSNPDTFAPRTLPSTQRLAEFSERVWHGVLVVGLDGVVQTAWESDDRPFSLADRDPTGDFVLTRIHPEDLARVLANLEEHRRNPDRPIDAAIRVRIAADSDEYVWLWGVSVLIDDATIMVAGRYDVGERIDTEAGPDGYSLAAVAPIGLALLTPTNRLVWSNARFDDLTDLHGLQGAELGAADAPVADTIREVAAVGRASADPSTAVISVGNHHLRLRAHVVPNTLADVMLSVEDITSETVANAERTRADRIFAAAFDNCPAGMAVVDGAGTILAVNNAWSTITGHHIDDLRGRPYTDLAHPAELAEHTQRGLELLSGERREFQIECRLQHRDGTYLWAELRTAAVAEDAATTLGTRPQRFVTTITDVTERKSIEDRLRADNASLTFLATHDHLTGLPNRALLDRRLEAVAEGCDVEPAAILFCDLDGFKAINDRFGHRVGDDVLIGVARRLRAICNDRPLVARSGGDEFVVIAPDSGPDHALALARRIIVGLERPFDIVGQRVQISASVGVTRAMPGQVPADAMHTADELALGAKRDGGGIAWITADGSLGRELSNRGHGAGEAAGSVRRSLTETQPR